MENESKKIWQPIYKGMSKEALKTSFRNNLQYALAKDKYTATAYDNFLAMSITVRDRLVERWIATQQRYHKQNIKRVYYLSLEFLIGRLLGNNILNLGLWKESKTALKELDLDIKKLREEEQDAGLGNGGLGRLAACFLDSMATLGIPAHGYGIRYEYGIFHQRVINGYQVEFPDEWLKLGNPWEISRPEYTVTVKFYGRILTVQDKKGKEHRQWVDTKNVLAMPYDIPVPGYKNDVVNTLRLWSARSSEEFNFSEFNEGDYEGAVYDKVSSENISKVLYPSDINTQGRELRLKQEYFFTAASVADIIRRFKAENQDLRGLPQKAVIQLNDTHPCLAIVEFMRLMVDEENLDWDTAWGITLKMFAYTNHTIMPEALEVWPVSLMENMLPRHMQIIYEINHRFLAAVAAKFPGDSGRLQRMSIIEESNPKRVRMAYLSIAGSHSVNGVSALHTTLLKQQLFKDFFELFPERFNNKTNGITQRRWLNKANMPLADLITNTIGQKWVTNLFELKKLANFKQNASFQKKWGEVKSANKKFLADYIYKQQGVLVDHASLFDVQIKRIHEYKRQALFVFYIILQYCRLKDNPSLPFLPRTFIFSGKAAPGYFMAKLVIKFINTTAGIINKDKTVGDKLKVIFLENYGVSLAEKIFPASDLSEQISTAGTEASGTGCMKFMLNGALTIGTLDGANIEIKEAVGNDNIFIFGLKTEEIQQLKNMGYRPQDYIKRSPDLTRVFSFIQNKRFAAPDIFDPLIQNLINQDPFFICADFDSYCRTQENVSQMYVDQKQWIEKSIANVAASGGFSSDRTIREYAKEIWDIPLNP